MRQAPTPSLDAVTGAVFCGGASRRMGSDKALAEIDGRALLDCAVSVLQGVCGRVVLACGAEERYADRGLPRVLDALPAAGPLAGLSAVLEAAESEYVLALACDMPAADAGLARALVARAESESLDAALLAGERGVEPLFAVYRATCRGPVRAALERGERRMVAFHGGDVGGRPLRVASFSAAELGAPGADPTRNVNTPADLAAARAEVGR